MKDTAELFASLDALKARLDAHRPLPPDVVSQIREDMRVRFTYHSNAIEGNTLTMSETKAVLEDGITIGGKSLKEYLIRLWDRFSAIWAMPLRNWLRKVKRSRVSSLLRKMTCALGEPYR
nr:hypothetical protein [Bilophila wadsworthia]